VKEHPLLFDAESIEAYWAGRKSQTRRLITSRNSLLDGKPPSVDCAGAIRETIWMNKVCLGVFHPTREPKHAQLWLPRIQPGDAIWWRSSIHMPRKACRIVTPIIRVRAERVNDITLTDIRAEGYPGPFNKSWMYQWWGKRWDAINRKRAPYSSNPWVWVYEWKGMV